jgi:hypothetical protein
LNASLLVKSIKSCALLAFICCTQSVAAVLPLGIVEFALVTPLPMSAIDISTHCYARAERLMAALTSRSTEEPESQVMAES